MAAKTTTVLNVRVRRGENMTKGRGWNLVAPGKRRAFKGVLLETLYVGKTRVAIFRVRS